MAPSGSTTATAMGMVTDLGASEVMSWRSAPIAPAMSTTLPMPTRHPTSVETATGSRLPRSRSTCS